MYNLYWTVEITILKKKKTVVVKLVNFPPPFHFPVMGIDESRECGEFPCLPPSFSSSSSSSSFHGSKSPSLSVSLVFDSAVDSLESVSAVRTVTGADNKTKSSRC